MASYIYIWFLHPYIGANGLSAADGGARCVCVCLLTSCIHFYLYPFLFCCIISCKHPLCRNSICTREYIRQTNQPACDDRATAARRRCCHSLGDVYGVMRHTQAQTPPPNCINSPRYAARSEVHRGVTIRQDGQRLRASLFARLR